MTVIINCCNFDINCTIINPQSYKCSKSKPNFDFNIASAGYFSTSEAHLSASVYGIFDLPSVPADILN